MQVYIKNTQNSWITITGYIAFNGISVSKTDIESPNTGTNILGGTIRDKIGSKRVWSIQTKPIPAATVATIENLMDRESFQFRTDSATGALSVFTTYCSAIDKKHVVTKGDTDYYTLSFEVKEI